MTTAREVAGGAPTAPSEEDAALFPRALVDSLPFLVWLEDEQGRLLMGNAEFSRWVRDDAPETLQGSPTTALRARDSSTGLTGTTGLSELRYLDRRGDPRWIETWSAPLRGQAREGMTIRCARDNKSRKAVEQELKRTLAFVQGIKVVEMFATLARWIPRKAAPAD